MIHGSPQGRDLDQGLFMAAALDGDRVLRQTGQQEVWEETDSGRLRRCALKCFQRL